MAWRVRVVAVPKASGLLASLFGGGGPAGGVVRALCTITAARPAEAKRWLSKLPYEIGPYETEQEARVTAQTLQDEGARCEMVEV